MTPHKHSKLIKAWADGAEIQQSLDGVEWHDCHPEWDLRNNYRLRPNKIAKCDSPVTSKWLRISCYCGTPYVYFNSIYAARNAYLELTERLK